MGELHLKQLDPSRKGLLKLPGSALKVWMCHWMHENFEGQSWPSIETICRETGLSWNTVVTWRSWLVEHGWLVKVGEKQPRHADGRFGVPVMAAKDGSKTSVTQNLGNGSGALDSTTPPVTQNTVTQNLGTEGSCSGFDFDSRSSSRSGSNALLNRLDSGLVVGHQQNLDESQSQNLEPKPKPAKVKVAGDGTPWPKDFDSWPNYKRLGWLAAHDGPANGEAAEADSETAGQSERQNPSAQAPVPAQEASPPSSAPPPNGNGNLCHFCQKRPIWRNKWCDHCHWDGPYAE